ncbi:crotonase/enoyl-CoA hydratase family protein [Aeromicrobium alkaliterrae]|uniref:Crotonase/enoyl-CoA hydratase family protein n=1 Tax=Aeromicrobium alkaliterrae TaxID=302168 RepID=A0ABN2KFB9_9ACTN
MNSPLHVERDDHVETWTMNVAQQRNALSGTGLMEALTANVERVNVESTVRAVVLTGAGSTFSAGGNLKDMIEGKPPFGGTPHQSMGAYRHGIQRLAQAVHGCEIPVIAAVNGHAIGAGCDLALMCDIRLASQTATFAESFVKLGIIPGDGGAWLLPRAVGWARAAEMALTGDSVDADTAHEWGLVSKVVEPSSLLTEALDLARRIASNPPHAVRMAKRLLRSADSGTLSSILELSAAFQAIAHTTRDHHEALTALTERRSPRYGGE